MHKFIDTRVHATIYLWFYVYEYTYLRCFSWKNWFLINKLFILLKTVKNFFSEYCAYFLFFCFFLKKRKKKRTENLYLNSKPVLK